MGDTAEALSAHSNSGIRGRTCVKVGWFVCLTVSMVTTSKAAGLENILYVLNLGDHEWVR